METEDIAPNSMLMKENHQDNGAQQSSEDKNNDKELKEKLEDDYWSDISQRDDNFEFDFKPPRPSLRSSMKRTNSNSSNRSKSMGRTSSVRFASDALSNNVEHKSDEIDGENSDVSIGTQEYMNDKEPSSTQAQDLTHSRQQLLNSSQMPTQDLDEDFFDVNTEQSQLKRATSTQLETQPENTESYMDLEMRHVILSEEMMQDILNDPFKRRTRASKRSNNVTPTNNTDQKKKQSSPPKRRRTNQNNKPKKEATPDKEKQKKTSKKQIKSDSSDSESSDDGDASEDEPVQRGKYKLGQYVWAKMKTYPWWPAQIVDPKEKDVPKELKKANKTTVLVRFCDSDDYARVELKNVTHFELDFKKHYKTQDPKLREAIEYAIGQSKNEEQLLEIFDGVEDSKCDKCRQPNDPDKLLLCDQCNFAYHLYCLEPPLTEVPETNWYCEPCKLISNGDVAPSDVNLSRVPITVIVPGIAGLVNVGNSCYINSALQCLNAVSDFRTSLDNFPTNNELVSTLQRIMTSQWSGKPVDFRLLKKLKEDSGNALDFKYHGNQHQDLNEFLVQLLDYLHEHIVQAKKKVIVNSGDRVTESSTVIEESIRDDSETQSSQNNNHTNTIVHDSFVMNHFDGILSRIRRCPKMHESRSDEAFRILTLQFPPQYIKAKNQKKLQPLTLKKMLKDLTIEEVVECRCTECGGQANRKFKQTTEITRYPETFVIQLGRFCSVSTDESWWSHKIHTEVKFPLDNFHVASVFSKQSDGGPVYDLTSVVNHKGGMNGGHYWCYCKSTPGDWYNFNDNTVKLISSSDVNSPFAYMLFYTKRKE